MNNATPPAADLATHVKIVGIAVAATIAAGLVGTCAQTRPGGSKPILQTTSHIIARGN
jgi:hypothetical protein